MKKMEVQETIAFIGGAGKYCPDLMEKMVQSNLRLLFINKEGQESFRFVERLRKEQSLQAEIEVVNCVKESCWEADIIAFVNPDAIEEALLKKIKEVATQKILLLITTGDNPGEHSYDCRIGDLQQELPHSKIVAVEVDSQNMKAEIKASDPEALQTIQGVMAKAGYASEVLEIN